MNLTFVVVGLAVASTGVMAEAKLPPLRDPVFLNIGFVCQWQDSCIDKQKKAMKKALAFTKKTNPPSWKVHLCNRRAVQRRSGRIDWISYNNCIRSPAIAPQSVSRGGR